MIKRPLKTPSTRNVVMIVHHDDKAALEILNAMSKKLTLKAIVDLCKPIKMQKLYNKSTKHYCLGFDKSIVKDYERTVDATVGKCYQVMTSEELYEKYHNKLPVFFVEDIFKEKCVDLEQNNNPDGK